MGDSRCGVYLPTYTKTGTVTSIPSLASIARPAATSTAEAVSETGLTTNDTFADSSRTESDDHFTYGKLTWTSGNNSGIEVEVYLYVNDAFAGPSFYLLDSMPNAIAVGDTYEVYKGCNKTETACKGFSNFANYRGFNTMPGNDAILQYPDAKS